MKENNGKENSNSFIIRLSRYQIKYINQIKFFDVLFFTKWIDIVK